MSTDFPTALDSFPAIGPNTQENDTGVEHDVVHSNVHDAITALQTKVGIDSSADAASIDNRLAVAETVIDLNADDIEDINAALAASYFVPAGGTIGQAVVKLSNADGDYGWGDAGGTGAGIANRLDGNGDIRIDGNGDLRITN